jgi:hypothetical protein
MNAELQDFQSLLAETGIEFQPTPDFVSCPVLENNVFRYQYAMRSPSGELEMRFRIDSFARLEAECKTGMEEVDMLTRVSLNKSYTANFVALIHNLSGGRFVEPTVIKPESTALLYDADWSALCFLRLVDNGFAANHDSAYVLAIHKDGVADVYVIGVYNDKNGTTGDFDKDNLPTDVKKYLVPALRFT